MYTNSKRRRESGVWIHNYTRYSIYIWIANATASARIKVVTFVVRVEPIFASGAKENDASTLASCTEPTVASTNFHLRPRRPLNCGVVLLVSPVVISNDCVSSRLP